MPLVTAVLARLLIHMFFYIGGAGKTTVKNDGTDYAHVQASEIPADDLRRPLLAPRRPPRQDGQLRAAAAATALLGGVLLVVGAFLPVIRTRYGLVGQAVLDLSDMYTLRMLLRWGGSILFLQPKMNIICWLNQHMGNQGETL